MRIMIKGGVWKNTEDEILKAAVMKYGKNQWARISSLLVRKSAKQCKARWYEWLDPSIKKTEWTREEDEKLLHLAKLMPTQWRTIAPIVGRTPSQCLERYEKLLDAACVKDENYEPADDPRKLRPGEIDPNPESKPARPDPVDMDEDEKEMLSEARARLANTRGKKAKRKAREKQLEEARRLASLQKRRELKAAGIEGKQRKRKRKGIDYNAEIPFEKKPPPGFFDVADEERQVEQPKFPTTIEELEGIRRVDIEARLRKQDVARNKIQQRHDTPSAVMQVNKLNDPEAVRKRSKLMLPAPQISDRELEEIAKMGYASDLVLGEDELTAGSGAAHALLANYNQTPRLGMTPLRTPQRTPGGKGDAIMMEAENQARLREAQTPLFGGENPELHPSDFSGVTPKKREIQTPNPMATPLQTPGTASQTPRIGMTPSRELSTFGMTPRGTPIRDELHINEGMETPDSSKAESRRQAEIRKKLRESLGSLPAPQNEYQIVVPDLPTEDTEVGEQMEEDMSDRLAREKAEEAARQAALLRKRSKVLQRDLPRPPVAAVDFLKNSLTQADDDKGSIATANFMEQADELIRKELASLLEDDSAKYPLEDELGKEKRKSSKNAPNGRPQVPIPQIDDFDEEEIKEASQLIEEEVSILRVGMGHEEATVDDFTEAHSACYEDMMYFPSRNSYGLSSVASSTDKLAALQNEFENVRDHMESGTRKAVRLEQKVKVLTQGYQMRAAKLWTQIEATFKQADTYGTELECFKALHKQEQLAASNRIESLREAVSQQKDLERQLQIRYENLLVEQDNLQRLLQEYKEQIPPQNDSDKEKASGNEQSQLDVCQADIGGLDFSNVDEEASKISSECNDVEMPNNSAIDGHVSLPQVEDNTEKGSDSSSKQHDAENSENAMEMQIDHVPQADGPDTLLDNENTEQILKDKQELDSDGCTASSHNDTNEHVKQEHSDMVVPLDVPISVAEDVNMEETKEQSTDMVAQSNSQDGILMDKDDEQPKQQSYEPVAQSDVQNVTLKDENVEQILEQKEVVELLVPSENNSSIDGHVSLPQVEDNTEKGSDSSSKQHDAEYSENAMEMQIDHVPQADGPNTVLDNENSEQVSKDKPELDSGGCTACSHNDTIEHVKQEHSDMVVPVDAPISVVEDVDMGKAKEQSIDMVAKSNSQDDILMDKNDEQPKQQSCEPVAQSDVQNVTLKDENVEQIEEQKEVVELLVPSENHINTYKVDKSHEDPDKQVEVSDVPSQAVLAETESEVDIIVDDYKANSEKQLLLQKSDTERENVTTGDTSASAEDVPLQQ